MPSDPESRRPDRIGRYRITGELGRGGMGVVYRAEDERLGRPVALKVLPAHLGADATARERLLVEARAAAALDHPHVCTVYEVGEDAERPYIAFACYDGETLRDRLGGGALPVPEAVRIAREVASGVAAAHARGIVHRDLKPSNVFLCEDGTARVLDFGIAKLQDASLTATGQTPGTVAYGAPETAEGRADARADVWSLGVVLYEMLAGRRPFSGGYPSAVLYAVLHEEPPPPSALNPDVPEAVDAVVMRCLAKEPEGRYADAGAVAAALGAEGARPDAAALRVMGRRLRRSRAWQAVAMLLLLVGGVGVWQAASGEGQVPLPDMVHLAVLPPTLDSDSERDRAVVEGIAETISAGIESRMPQNDSFWVVPQVDVFGLGASDASGVGVLNANVALAGKLERGADEVSLYLRLLTVGEDPALIDRREVTVPLSDEASLAPRALRAASEMLGLPGGSAGPMATGRLSGNPIAQNLYHAGVGYLERDLQSRDLDRAVEQFGLAVQEDSAFALAHARLAEAALLKFEESRDESWVDRARRSSGAALRHDDESVRVHVALSKLNLVQGKYPAAMRHARRAYEASPNDPSALIALASAQEKSADIEAAERTLVQAVRQAPTAWAGYLRLGGFYYNLNRFGEAAAQFQRVIDLAPRYYKGYLELGIARQRAGDLDAARDAYQRVVELRPETYEVYANRGTMLLWNLKDPAGAIEEYRRALEIDDANHTLWANLAGAYYDLGDSRRHRWALGEALTRVRAYLDVNPRDAQAVVSDALYSIALGNPRGAVRNAERAVDLAPSAPDVLYDAASVFALAGDEVRMRNALEAAVDAGHELDDILEDDAFNDFRETVLSVIPGTPHS